jgi:hypothetical protein
MNAETMARRVLEWAADPTSGLPAGPLRQAGDLAHPSPPTLTALTVLVRQHAARAGAGRLPFGDRSAVGLGAVLLAAAIGGRGEPGVARTVVEAVDPPQLVATGWVDALARHAVLEPALPWLTDAAPSDESEPLADTMLRVSPLTAVLYRPPLSALDSGATAREVATARSLMTRPHGVDLLQATLSTVTTEPAVLAWRQELLTRLVIDDPVFVVDTYVTARLRHGQRWDAAISAARITFAGLEAPDALSMATARYWLPLAQLRRSHPDLVRQRRLMRGHQEALRLVEGRHRASIAGVA